MRLVREWKESSQRRDPRWKFADAPLPFSDEGCGRNGVVHVSVSITAELSLPGRI
jgi:hypothetical protein